MKKFYGCKRIVNWPTKQGNYSYVNVSYNIGWDVTYHFIYMSNVDNLLSKISEDIKIVNITNLTERQENTVEVNNLCRKLRELLNIQMIIPHLKNFMPNNLIGRPYVISELFVTTVVLGYDNSDGQFITVDSEGMITKKKEVSLGVSPMTIPKRIDEIKDIIKNTEILPLNEINSEIFPDVVFVLSDKELLN